MKSQLRSFAADFSCQLSLAGLGVQKECVEKIDRAIKSRDSGDIAKKDQALVVRTRLKRMSSEAMNIIA